MLSCDPFLEAAKERFGNEATCASVAAGVASTPFSPSYVGSFSVSPKAVAD